MTFIAYPLEVPIVVLGHVERRIIDEPNQRLCRWARIARMLHISSRNRRRFLGASTRFVLLAIGVRLRSGSNRR